MNIAVVFAGALQEVTSAMIAAAGNVLLFQSAEEIKVEERRLAIKTLFGCFHMRKKSEFTIEPACLNCSHGKGKNGK